MRTFRSQKRLRIRSGHEKIDRENYWLSHKCLTALPVGTLAGMIGDSMMTGILAFRNMSEQDLKKMDNGYGRVTLSRTMVRF